MLRASIIHLNHELAARTVCACGRRLRDSNAVFLHCICGVADMKHRHVLHSSRHTNMQSFSARGLFQQIGETWCCRGERDSDGEVCDAPCAGCLSELSSASSSDPTALSATVFTSRHISRQCLSNLVVVLWLMWCNGRKIMCVLLEYFQTNHLSRYWACEILP